MTKIRILGALLLAAVCLIPSTKNIQASPIPALAGYGIPILGPSAYDAQALDDVEARAVARFRAEQIQTEQPNTQVSRIGSFLIIERADDAEIEKAADASPTTTRKIRRDIPQPIVAQAVPAASRCAISAAFISEARADDQPAPAPAPKADDTFWLKLIATASTLLLSLSETMPFLKFLKGNGIIHAIVGFFYKLTE